VLVIVLMQEISGDQHRGGLAGILPPMRRALGLLGDVAGVMDDRHGAVAGVLGDLTNGDVDQGWAIVVAVPGHLAARLDREPAHAEQAALHADGLGREVD
jgi:hypothetical protein